MNQDQIKMLSVKNTVERMVAGLISSYKEQTHLDDLHKQFIEAVGRVLASLYVSQQIIDYRLYVTYSSLEVWFKTQEGHGTTTTFFLPASLEEQKLTPLGEAVRDLERKKADKQYLGYDADGQPIFYNDLEYFQDKVTQSLAVPQSYFEGVRSFENEPAAEASHKDILLEGSIRKGAHGQLEMYVNGKWVTVPSHSGIGSGSNQAAEDKKHEPEAAKEEEFDPFEAYERAKRAVRNM